MQREETPDGLVLGRFLAAVSALDGHDRRAALRAYRDLLSWTCEDHEELIFRTREKYAAEKRRLIEFNNRLVLAKYRRRRPDSVLMLLPFCLQSRACPHQVAWACGNCRRCGGCPVGGLLAAADERGVPVRIAVRSTFAPDFVQEVRPELVFAVACEHELLAGLLRVAPTDCCSAILGRPEGACRNTRVDVAAVAQMLDRFARR